MSFIYSFLQKRKMHESQHGIVMVIIAYALSVLLLALGSDVFYNIKSSAAGKDTEETQELILENQSLQDENITSLTLPSKLINPYHLENIPDIKLGASNTAEIYNNADTIWLLGSGMDNETFDTIMSKNIGLLSGDKKDNKSSSEQTSKAKTTNSDKTKSISVKVASSHKVITVSSEEVKMLERIVQAEAEGEDMEGKILVANVIFNRIVDKEFPDSVEGVIFQKVHGDYQFSPVKSGRYRSVKISKATKEAVLRALDGEDYSKGALYFVARKHTTTTKARWFDNNLDWLFVHGGHDFYK